MLVQVQETKNDKNNFWVGVVKNGYGHVVHETLKVMRNLIVCHLRSATED